MRERLAFNFAVGRRFNYIVLRYFILSYIHSRQKTTAQHFNCTAELWGDYLYRRNLAEKGSIDAFGCYCCARTVLIISST